MRDVKGTEPADATTTAGTSQTNADGVGLEILKDLSVATIALDLGVEITMRRINTAEYSIYYTTDGSVPDLNSSKYADPFTLAYDGKKEVSIKASLLDDKGMLVSPTVELVLKYIAPKLTFTQGSIVGGGLAHVIIGIPGDMGEVTLCFNYIDDGFDPDPEDAVCHLIVTSDASADITLPCMTDNIGIKAKIMDTEGYGASEVAAAVIRCDH
ncbi:MAG: chitobiase/beta-hexosaminidase C-terminal domain-containing protein [bacterium]